MEKIEKIMRYESPFSWDMTCFIEGTDNVVPEEGDDSDSKILLLSIIKKVCQLCEAVLRNNSELVNELIEKLLEVSPLITESNLENGMISAKVVNHVIDSTLFHSLMRLNRTPEALLIESDIADLDLSDHLQSSTLAGCKSAVWSNYFEDGAVEALMNASEAKNLNPECALWHYLAGLNSRRIRRRDGFMDPTSTEQTSFMTAYKISNHPTYGIAMAQCYKESRERKKALQLYREVQRNLQSGHLTLYCKLAMGFLSYNLFDEANECLKKAELIDPNASILLHYKGLFFFKLSRFDSAELYFREASKSGNFRAEMNHAECFFMNHPDENIIDLLKSLFEKYDSEKHQQHLWLHIGMVYSEEYCDLENALVSFEKGIRINPSSGIVLNYHYLLKKKIHLHRNIYKFLDKQLLLQASEVYDTLDSKSKEAFHELNNYVEMHFRQVNLSDEIQNSEQNLNALTL